NEILRTVARPARGPAADEHQREQTLGLLLGLAAYGCWGLFPIYIKSVAAPPVELLAHRVVWSLILLLALSAYQRRWGELRAALRRPGTPGPLALRPLVNRDNLVGPNRAWGGGQE